MKNINFCNEELEEEGTDLSKPTIEDYEKAKQDREYAANALFLCRKRRDDLIDELAREREHEKFYLQMYEKHRDIIRRYEFYEKLKTHD